MLKFSAASQIWKKYIQKLIDWDLPLISVVNSRTKRPLKAVLSKFVGPVGQSDIF